MNLFQNARFFTTVNHLKDLPDTPAEIAFVGRSNAGKSSAINTLCNHVRLAYVSKTPGRTQHINFFELTNGHFMVDLPGYGYAQVPEAIRTHWVKLLGDYLQTRRQLIGLVLIMDARHPLKPLDIQMLDFFALTEKPVHILLSKADKLSKNEQIKTLASVHKQLKPFTERQAISVQLFSSLKKQGIDEVEETVSAWFAMLPEKAITESNEV
ncbi:ribosome biogenesis GTP-binding protein YihA/YsxC [Simonsiella muelleri]|uniref:Probable GTP-binding protein EngB n=1 Tax=Simonsiella muelleri ATCC 29453 TaxID=641147 RepID=V9HE52_9NEIS|nr:ribosome biogenesis GTP-binding protein YihA/YsxC [Simonsiella muelleri]AUX60465.1 YihA family ribosome biogenesis GTP-binding protein [Simonsiella muelleri ATCC 29453]EFG32011.1 ribosome biogenesis GTP-binding protein YsxC [Simonsiella muelleri ATCC 29453]UBQ54711.1 ribosome biogenesis GTP-binding protein YihA/YsxC [Simonsiella muelleri]